MFDVSPEVASFWYDAFNVILFLGAFAVAVGTYGSIKMGAVKERFANERISENEAAATKAIAESDAAKRGAAEANAHALEAQLALEKYKSPRVLTPDQQQEIARALSAFQGQRISIGAIPPTFEHVALAEFIFNAITLAGIKPNFNQGAAEVQVGPVRGVVARYVTGNERGRSFAITLAESLSRAGVVTSAIDGMMDRLIKPEDRNSEGHSWVVVVIGEKPP